MANKAPEGDGGMKGNDGKGKSKGKNKTKDKNKKALALENQEDAKWTQEIHSPLGIKLHP